MGQWAYFELLAKEAAKILVAGWPITALLLLLVVAAAAWHHGELKAALAVHSLWQLMPLAVPVGLLALGTWYVCHLCSHNPNVWAMRTGHLLLIGQLVLGALLVRAASPLRLLAASLQLFILWVSCVTGFLAFMSMSGDWL